MNRDLALTILRDRAKEIDSEREKLRLKRREVEDAIYRLALGQITPQQAMEKANAG